jgi:hypothetical protein
MGAIARKGGILGQPVYESGTIPRRLEAKGGKDLQVSGPGIQRIGI